MFIYLAVAQDNFIIILVTVIITIITVLGGSIFTLIHFIHKDDRAGNWFAKIIVVLSLFSSVMVLMMLPLDADNRGGVDMPMEMIWVGMMFLIAVLVLFLVPVAYLWVDADEDATVCEKIWGVVKWMFWLWVVFGTSLGVMYVFLGSTQIPVEDIQVGWAATFAEQLPVPASPDTCDGTCPTTVQIGYWERNVSIIVYMIAIMSLLGWLVLVFFGGVGLVSAPVSMVFSYIDRPRKIELDQFAKLRTVIRERTESLIEFGKTFDAETSGRAMTSKQKNMFQNFKQAAYALEADWQKLRISYKGPFNTTKYLITMIFGFVGGLISVLWIVHIALYLVAQVHPFLDLGLVLMDKFFGVTAKLVFPIFAFWLLFTVLYGNIKIGERIVCFPLHPLAEGKTHINSFLFNSVLVLSTTVAVVAMCANSFALFVRLTATSMIFNYQIQYLVGLKYVWINFHYVLFGIIFLSSIYFACRPRPASKNDELQKDLEAMVRGDKQKSSCAIL